MSLLVTSTLPEETEKVIHSVIGCALEVHRHLHVGYVEGVYHTAMKVELGLQGLRYESERRVVIEYKGHQIHGQRIDLIVENCLVVELKSVSHLEYVHKAQVVSYLRATGLRAGLLINFNSDWLKHGIRRIVL